MSTESTESNSETEPCDDCGESVSDALARVIRVTVDRSGMDKQRLCPTCFAAWVDTYTEQMQQDDADDDGWGPDHSTEFIVE